MKIFCTVIRKNGTYKTISIKAGKEKFELDKNIYFIREYKIGKLFGITVLRSFYVEGYPLPIEIDVDAAMKTAKLKIDSKAIKHLTNKKIIGVFGEAELTRLEELVLIVMIGAVGLGAANLIIAIIILNKISEVIP